MKKIFFFSFIAILFATLSISWKEINVSSTQNAYCENEYRLAKNRASIDYRVALANCSPGDIPCQESALYYYQIAMQIAEQNYLFCLAENP